MGELVQQASPFLCGEQSGLPVAGSVERLDDSRLAAVRKLDVKWNENAELVDTQRRKRPGSFAMSVLVILVVQSDTLN